MKRAILFLALILIVAGLVGTSVYFYTRYQASQKLLQNPVEVAKLEGKRLVTLVGKLMELPTDEEPTVATVADRDKLKDQQFFANAQNGDKVLIYSKAKKAILYRPSTNKVIEMAPINLGQGQQAQPLRVAIYNGTQSAGLIARVEKEFKDRQLNLAVMTKSNAKKRDYATTLIIDLTGKQNVAAAQLADLLGGRVTTLPAGETSPEAIDLLVIVGSDLTEKLNTVPPPLPTVEETPAAPTGEPQQTPLTSPTVSP